jgi:glycosyltransferase involved in cell wall biosynthesis
VAEKPHVVATAGLCVYRQWADARLLCSQSLPCDLMRVLVVTNMYPSATEPQFGSFVKEQVDDLRELGLDVRVFSFDGRQRWTAYAVAARKIRDLVERDRVDLVHAHYGLCGAAALAQRRVPVVTTFHGSDFTGAIPWQVWVSRIVARRSSPIFVSATGAMRLPRGAPIIPAGVDMELFKPIEREDARRRLGWRVDGRYLLFPSSPRLRAKRVDLFEAALREAAARVPTLSAIYLEGFSREQVALVMNAVDATVMTSDREGSPVTVRESLACQTPVVSVPVGDLPRVLSGLPGCAVVPRDSSALARAILEALEAGRPSELRARADRWARPRIAEKIVGVYEGVLRNR